MNVLPRSFARSHFLSFFPHSCFLSLFLANTYAYIQKSLEILNYELGTNIPWGDHHRSEYYKIFVGFSISLSLLYRRRERNVASDSAILESDSKDCAGSRRSWTKFSRNHGSPSFPSARSLCEEKGSFAADKWKNSCISFSLSRARTHSLSLSLSSFILSVNRGHPHYWNSYNFFLSFVSYSFSGLSVVFRLI